MMAFLSCEEKMLLMVVKNIFTNISSVRLQDFSQNHLHFPRRKMPVTAFKTYYITFLFPLSQVKVLV